MSENTKRVSEFVAAWRRGDVEELMTFIAPDCLYHNIPMEPVMGAAAIRAALSGFAKLASEAEWVLHQIAENAHGVVLTERTDRFKVAGKWVELPVMGAFELRDGLITAWRDYFDLAQFNEQLPASGG
jgi:limonene-1,2-epoxide hydrolase